MPSQLSARTLEGDPTQTLPCRRRPAAWDIPIADYKAEFPIIRHRVIAALEGCSSCPALDWCRGNAHRNPPQHHCVQGGEIWPGVSGHPDGAAASRRRAVRPVPYTRWKPKMVPCNGRAEVSA